MKKDNGIRYDNLIEIQNFLKKSKDFNNGLHEFKGRNIIVVSFEPEKQVETFEKFYNSLVKDGDFF